MHKSKSKKKLSLPAETLRRLQHNQLHEAAGGQTLAQCSTICTDLICPDTQFIHGCNG